jgi:outer membrane receptor for ferric coprogen and ferric-rhodotorulic acid
MLRKKTLAVALAAVWGMTPPAWAEEQNQNTLEVPETVLKEVSVNAATSAELPSEATGSYAVRGSSAATGLDLDLSETPQAVTVITREQMDDFRLTNVNDVLDNATGVVVERVETDRTYYTARGSDIINFQLDGIGLPLNFGLATGDIDTAVYDRVEVIRGANGLMSGTGNPSAGINFVRKRPTKDFQASVEASAGSWSNNRLTADISGSLNEAGNGRGRFVAVEQDKDSYIDRYHHDKTVLYGIAEADITDNTLLTIGHTYQSNRADGVMWGALPLVYTNGARIHYDVSASPAADWTFWNGRDHQTFAELSHLFDNGWEAKGTLTYRRSDEHGQMLYAWENPGVDADTGLGVTPYASNYVQKVRQSLGDAYVRGPFTLAGREHQLTVGVNWAKSHIEAASLINNASFSDVLTLEQWLAGNYAQPAFTDDGGDAEFEDRRSGVYAAAHFNVTDRLDVIGGARMTNVESEGESYGVAHNYERNGKVTPYAGIVYALTPIHSIFASYTEIFNPQTEVDINRQPLDPLEGENYEVGVKSEWLGKKLNSTVSLFRSKQDNIAEAAGTIPASFDAYYRGVTATTKGIEVDVAGEVTDRLSVQGGATVLSLRGEDGEDVKTYTPRHLFDLSMTYRVPRVEKLKVGMGVHWQGDIHTDIGSTRVEQDSYALLNLLAEYKLDEQWKLALNVNNVTDEKYLSSLRWTQSLYGTPRNAMLTLSWTY